MKIVIADPVDKEMIEYLQTHGFEVLDCSDNRDQLMTQLTEAGGLIVRSATQVNSELLSNAPNLRVIGRPGVGLDNIDQDYCKANNIRVFNSPEAPSRSVAEFTFGLIIDLARKISISHKRMQDGKWAKKEALGIELEGKTLGIIGTGAIGKFVASFGEAFGMKTIGYDIIKNPELESLSNFSYVEFDDLLVKSDIITVHVPLLNATKHLLNKDTFHRMKVGVLLVNAARGGIIHELDLIQALKEGIIGGVALDTFESEPNINAELRTFDNIILTPHIGASTKEAQQKNGLIVAEKIVNHFK